MARIVRKSSHLEDEYTKIDNKKVSGILLFIIFSVLSVILFVMYTHYVITAFLIIGIAVLTFAFALLVFSLKKSNPADKNIIAAGIQGENLTAHILSALPDDYTVFQDVYISYDKKTSEIDNIVVGKTGVFIIETKNHNGIISGSYDDKMLLQIKIGRGGTAYSSSFYNPVKQVGTHIYRLANYLRSKGIYTYINGIVFFSNSEADVKVKTQSDGVPVFSYNHNHGKDMISYILNSKESLSGKQVSRIVKLLEK